MEASDGLLQPLAEYLDREWGDVLKVSVKKDNTSVNNYLVVDGIDNLSSEDKEAIDFPFNSVNIGDNTVNYITEDHLLLQGAEQSLAESNEKITETEPTAQEINLAKKQVLSQYAKDLRQVAVDNGARKSDIKRTLTINGKDGKYSLVGATVLNAESKTNKYNKNFFSDVRGKYKEKIKVSVPGDRGGIKTFSAHIQLDPRTWEITLSKPKQKKIEVKPEVKAEQEGIKKYITEAKDKIIKFGDVVAKNFGSKLETPKAPVTEEPEVEKIKPVEVEDSKVEVEKPIVEKTEPVKVKPITPAKREFEGEESTRNVKQKIDDESPKPVEEAKSEIEVNEPEPEVLDPTALSTKPISKAIIDEEPKVDDLLLNGATQNTSKKGDNSFGGGNVKAKAADYLKLVNERSKFQIKHGESNGLKTTIKKLGQ